jgi:hypothetical protein
MTMGCGMEGEGDLDALAADAVAPPMSIGDLELYGGEIATVVASGANPGDRVVFLASTSTGSGPCPPPLNGQCFALGTQFRRIGSAFADSAGNASVSFRAPYGLIDSLLYIQAASAGGGSPYMSSRRLGIVQDPSCELALDDFWAVAEETRYCQTDAECGQVLMGTSCGCTNNWVANISSDTSLFYDMLDAAEACGLALFSTCDCPPANGFACVDNECTWNYGVP